METLNSAKEIKNIGIQKIKSINGTDFSKMYPMLEVTNKHVSYYSAEKQGNVHLNAPYEIKLK